VVCSGLRDERVVDGDLGLQPLPVGFQGRHESLVVAIVIVASALFYWRGICRLFILGVVGVEQIIIF
jgi:hypothetical protein